MHTFSTSQSRPISQEREWLGKCLASTNQKIESLGTLTPVSPKRGELSRYYEISQSRAGIAAAVQHFWPIRRDRTVAQFFDVSHNHCTLGNNQPEEEIAMHFDISRYGGMQFHSFCVHSTRKAVGSPSPPPRETVVNCAKVPVTDSWLYCNPSLHHIYAFVWYLNGEILYERKMCKPV